MRIDIREITGFASYIRANKALGQEHYDEIVGIDPSMPYDLDPDKFERVERTGMLACVGAFDGDKLVGYSATLISEHLHHRGTVVGLNDLLFLSKPYRHGKNGVLLMEETKRVCKARGAHLVFWCAHKDTALYRIMERSNCKRLETIFSEEL